MSFTVTEIVTATRCPRQLVLAREGRRVVPWGGAAIGQVAHAGLATLVAGAAADDGLARALAADAPEAEKVAAACYRLAYGEVFRRALKLAPGIDGAELSRLDSVVRNVTRLIATLLVRARKTSRSAETAIGRALLAAEAEVELELGDVRVRGRIDLLCHDAATDETWLWDLKTYAGTDAAQEEQVRLYALAYARRDVNARPALLHITGDRIAITQARSLGPDDEPRLRTMIDHMTAWLEGTRPPPAARELETCGSCPAQDACWSRWGRTLPDEEAPVRRTAEPIAHAARVMFSRRHDGPSSEDPPTVQGVEAQRLTIPFGFTPWSGVGDDKPVGRETLPFDLVAGTDRESHPASVRSELFASRPSRAQAALSPAPLWLGDLDAGRVTARGGSQRAVVPARLEPNDLLRHVAVFGAPGAGKTYFAKAIVEEAALAGVPSLVLDVQGDLAQLAAIERDVSPALASRRDAYAEAVEVRLFTPASDAGLRVSLNPLRLPDPSLGEDERAFCLGAMAENLLSPLKIPSSWRDLAKGYVAQHLEAAVSDGQPLSLEALVERVRDPDPYLPVEPLANKSQRSKLFEQLRLLTVGTQRLLFQRGRPLDVGALVRPTEPGRTPVNVVWLNALGDQEAKERFIAMVLADVYAWMLKHPRPTPQLLLYLDEVGPYIPPSREPASKKIIKRLFKEGRKYGVCGLFATQDFTDVDYKVFSQASTIALGRINSPQNKDKAKKVLGDAARFDVRDALDRLGSAPKGRFLMKCPDRFPGPEWLQARYLVTHHGSPWDEHEIRAHTPAALREWWSGAGKD